MIKEMLQSSPHISFKLVYSNSHVKIKEHYCPIIFIQPAV